MVANCPGCSERERFIQQLLIEQGRAGGAWAAGQLNPALAPVGGFVGGYAGQVAGAQLPKVRKGAKRKASAYSKRFGKEFKLLKKKHPRTQFSTLVKRAHRKAGGKK